MLFSIQKVYLFFIIGPQIYTEEIIPSIEFY